MKRVSFALVMLLSSCGDHYTDFTFRKFMTLERDEVLQSIPLAEDRGLVSIVYTPWIKGVDFPYNGGLVRLDNEWLLAFRENLPDSKKYWGFRPRMGVLRLDDAFRPKMAPDFVVLAPETIEDPRLVAIDNQLFVVANAGDKHDETMRNMTLMGLDKAQLGTGVLATRFVSTLSTGRTEKNWSPFIYDGVLHFSSHLSPSHDVRMLPYLDRPDSIIRLPSAKGIDWSFGKIRGGTPAVKLSDEQGYLGFFHSVYRTKSGRIIYFVGAYTFEAKPPFKMTAISEHPIIFRGLYESERSDLGGTDWFVAFATGLEVLNDRVFVSLGINDATLKIVEMDLHRLLASLRKI